MFSHTLHSLIIRDSVMRFTPRLCFPFVPLSFCLLSYWVGTFLWHGFIWKTDFSSIVLLIWFVQLWNVTPWEPPGLLISGNYIFIHVFLFFPCFIFVPEGCIEKKWEVLRFVLWPVVLHCGFVLWMQRFCSDFLMAQSIKIRTSWFYCTHFFPAIWKNEVDFIFCPVLQM